MYLEYDIDVGAYYYSFDASDQVQQIVLASGAVDTSMIYTGLSFTLGTPAIIQVTQTYEDASPVDLALSVLSTRNTMLVRGTLDGRSLTALCPPGTYYIWAKAGGNGNNEFSVLCFNL